MIVTTHFESLDGSPVSQGNLKLLELWKKSWEMRNFICILTDEGFISKNKYIYPVVKKFIETIERFPTVNKKGFDRASFIRWAAAYIVACEQDAPICISESDVINYTLFPCDLRELNTNLFNIADTDSCPAFVYTTKHQLCHLLLAITNHKLTDLDSRKGIPHISDQNYIAMYFRKDPIYNSVPYFIGSVFRTSDWKTRKLVHYGTPFFQKEKVDVKTKNKADYIDELRQIL